MPMASSRSGCLRRRRRMLRSSRSMTLEDTIRTPYCYSPTPKVNAVALIRGLGQQHLLFWGGLEQGKRTNCLRLIPIVTLRLDRRVHCQWPSAALDAPIKSEHDVGGQIRTPYCYSPTPKVNAVALIRGPCAPPRAGPRSCRCAPRPSRRRRLGPPSAPARGGAQGIRVGDLGGKVALL